MSTSKTKPFFKQASLESPLRSSGASNGDGTDSPKVLNRSLTVRGERRTSGAPGLKRARDPSSPLKRFTKAKDAISRAFGLIRDRLQEAQTFMNQADGEDSLAVSNLLDRTRGIEEMMSRDHMKVAFFGRTSNGKSTVINALLHDKVLPAGIGHTTNCFCSVRGVDTDEGYLLSPRSTEKQNVKNLTQLAHSLYKEHLEPSSLVQVFWPKTKCPLLKDDVEFVDSPGVDMNPNMDEWINKHCLDADVFVLVANAESTLMTAEKKFFHRVSERLSKPNIFILNNRWDCSAQEPDMTEEVKAQHLEGDVEFLSKDLMVVDEVTAKNRVFFVSAKEVLHVRKQQQGVKGQPSKEVGRGLADGWRLRLMAFDRFEHLFKECISSAAILTKFENHHSQGAEIVHELEQLLEQEEQSSVEKSQSVEEHLRLSWDRQRELVSEGSKVNDMCKQQITSTVNIVEQRLVAMTKDIEGQLREIVDRCDSDFDPLKVASYKQSLYKWVDGQLGQELNKVGAPELSKMYEETRKNFIGQYQKLLKLSDDDLSNFSLLARPPSLTFIHSSADLCEDFKEDLKFYFSFFGLTNLLNLGSLLGSVQTHISQLLPALPTDLLQYVVPGTLLMGFFLVPRLFNLRILIPSVVLFAGMYSYERLTWSDRTKKERLHKQFVDHMRKKLNTQIRATSGSYTAQMTDSLSLLLESLHGKLKDTQRSENNRISELTQEKSRLAQLLDKTKKLRNAVHLLESDFEDFKDEYLEDGDTHG